MKCLHDHGYNIDVGDGSKLPELCPIKEDELPAKRYKVDYRGEHFYLLIVGRNNKPWEIFAEHPTNRKPSLTFMMAGWDGMTRFVTMALKAYPLDKVIRQLKKSSRQKNDLPGIIAEKLEEWV
ncbi:MAG: hypothetical protein DRO67_02010 [Candidatus Asgardarchaeum californiense]|nr:MAG: hypothetical protein DRO67_02010 [Candidatus Asgardarchaeum californiense]